MLDASNATEIDKSLQIRLFLFALAVAAVSIGMTVGGYSSLLLAHILFGIAAVMGFTAVFWRPLQKLPILRLSPITISTLGDLTSDPVTWFGVFLTIISVLMMMQVGWMRRLSEDVTSIQVALKRYVLPRHITTSQSAIISDYLSKYPPQKIKFQLSNNYEECGEYRSEIQIALQKAGWTVDGIDYADNLPEGLTVSFVGPDTTDPKYPTSNTLLTNALQLAHIPINSNRSAGGANIKASTLILIIGRRRMDDEDILSKQETLEDLRKQIREQEQQEEDQPH